MFKYFKNRVIMMIWVLLGVSLVVFTMLYISPGDPARMMAGDYASEEDVAQMREELGLDRSYFERFASFLIGALQGDLGKSYVTKEPVTDEVFARYPTTILLASISVVVTLLIGIPAGIISAVKQYSIFDNATMTVALMGVSMPNFWQGMMSILIFSVWLGWFPSSGFYGWEYWVLPTLTIGSSNAATICRMTRSSMLEVIRQDYIRTARAKGQSEFLIIVKHALRNALIPIITVTGLQFGVLLGGAVLTETIFTIPGLGSLMVNSIKARNYPVVQGGVLIIAITFSFVNLLVDLLYAYVDPRIKAQYVSHSKKKV